MSRRGFPLAHLSQEQRDIALGRAPGRAPAPTPSSALATATPVAFFCEGLPATKGSTVSFLGREGDVITKGDNKRTKGWQRVVAAAALAAGVQVHDGPVQLELTFFLPRPQSHYRTGRHAGKVKPGAPAWPLTKPDGDKLERAILDALTRVAYPDDSRVVGVRWGKAWAPGPSSAGEGGPGVHVLVVPVLEGA